jgi:hypothetical protein
MDDENEMLMGDAEGNFGVRVLFVGKNPIAKRPTFTIVYVDFRNRSVPELVDLETHVVPAMAMPMIVENKYVEPSVRQAVQQYARVLGVNTVLPPDFLADNEAEENEEQADANHEQRTHRRMQELEEDEQENSSGSSQSDDADASRGGYGAAAMLLPRFYCMELREFVRKTVFATTAAIFDVVLDESPVFADEAFMEYCGQYLHGPGVCVHERSLRHLVCSLKSSLVRFVALHEYPDSTAQQSLEDEFHLLVQHCQTIYSHQMDCDLHGKWRVQNAMSDLEERRRATQGAPNELIYGWANERCIQLIDEGRVASHEASFLRTQYENALTALWEVFVREHQQLYGAPAASSTISMSSPAARSTFSSFLDTTASTRHGMPIRRNSKSVGTYHHPKPCGAVQR